MKDFIKKNKFNIIVILCYSVLTFIVLLFHESWRDEAQAWLIAKNLNIFDMLKQLTYEGHPALWYLILHPFARLGLPYITTKIISWIISVITVWLILKKAPFKNIIKILFICTYPMLYLYPAISRSYCLIPLAITLISIYYNKRHEKPIQYILLILLLANTHIVVYGMVGILLLLFYIEELNITSNDKKRKKEVYISLGIIVIGLIITTIPILISILQNAEVSKFTNINVSIIDNIIKIINALMEAIYYIFIYDISNIFTAFVLVIIVLSVLIYEIVYYKKNGLIILTTIFFELVINAFVYPGSAQRFNIFIYLIMFIYWIQKEKNRNNSYSKMAEIFLIFLLISNILNGIFNIAEDVLYEYSAAYETSKYIENNIDENSVLICNNMQFSSAIIPYINKNIFWSPQIEDYFSFVTWNEESINSYNIAKILEKIKKNFDENQKVYLLYSYYLYNSDMKELEDNNYIKKVFTSNFSKTENYIIYEIDSKFMINK